MTRAASLGSRIVARDLIIRNLLAESTLIGGIFTMGFDECVLLTNDLWKREAGGVPQHCFLLATAMTPDQTVPDLEDEEIILLRAVGPAPLPAEAELVQVRAEAMREMVVTRGARAAAASPAILDVLTRNEIQFSGIRAKILGTFYETGVNNQPLLAFGSDVDTFYSASHYKVYKPYGTSLARIVSFPQVTEQEIQDGINNPRRLQLGTVRYSSTTRRLRNNAAANRNTAIPVEVKVEDFISLKTAVFGMTRLGKSNTMKTIATAVFQHSMETGVPIGQLLFDPASEYVSVNVQDQTALSQIGPEFVTIFQFGADGTNAAVRPMSINFYSDATIEVTWSIVNAYLSTRTADYIKNFLAADVIGPDSQQANPSEWLRAARRRSAFYAILVKAGFAVPRSFNVTFGCNANVLAEVNQALSSQGAGQGAPQLFESDNRGNLRITTPDSLTSFWDCLLQARNALTTAANRAIKGTGAAQQQAQAAVQSAQASLAFIEQWIDPELDSILRVYSGATGSGHRLLQPMRIYHSATRNVDYAEEVLNELVGGKIVIVDLSHGSETVLQFCAERIINFIISAAASRFAAGHEAHRIQIFLEEAHRLFSREKKNKPSEVDPYVRLAKEAAKFKIGLIYATQEVTSVDEMILSNTSNWIVTHLNNHVEVKELSKYYDFEDFAELTMKAEDVGFARIKTRSGRFIIPTQIQLFSHERIESARRAGLASRASSPQGSAEVQDSGLF